jgi:hypothetical protein
MGAGIFLFATMFRAVLGPTHYPIGTWGTLHLFMKLITHLHLLSRSRMFECVKVYFLSLKTLSWQDTMVT